VPDAMKKTVGRMWCYWIEV